MPNLRLDEIADKVKNTLRSRQLDYDDPSVSCRTIAKFWNQYLDLPDTIEERDVAVMMILLKIARSMRGKLSADNYTDMAGYACLANLFVPADKEEESNDNE